MTRGREAGPMPSGRDAASQEKESAEGEPKEGETVVEHDLTPGRTNEGGGKRYPRGRKFR
jgi:hypothetical protein